MKLFAFLISIVLFLASFLLFGFAFDFAAPFDGLLFFGGIVAVALALALPFHLLEKFD